MKTLLNYYVVDSLTESVVGSFKAVNGVMATRILNDSFKKSEKLQDISDSLKLFCDSSNFDVLYETFEEVMKDCVDMDWKVIDVPQKTLDFGDNDGKK